MGVCKSFMLGASTLLALRGVAFSSPPSDNRSRPDSPTCFINQQALNLRVAALGKFAPGFAPPISASTNKIAVIRIDFSDKPLSKTLAETNSLLSSFRKFYAENSYGLLTVTATVSSGGSGSYGAFRMSRPHSYYAFGANSNYDALAQDAISAAIAGGFNFTGYDHIILYHAGDGAETTVDTNIWSVYLPDDMLSGPTLQGKKFNGLTLVPETEGNGVDPLGVVCHEYGHQLGLPDLYDTQRSKSVIGNWSLMDMGGYSGSPKGSNPSHFDAWSKQFLGFSSPETVTSSVNSARSLIQAETDRSAFLRVPIKNSSIGPDKEYYLVEYRRKSGGDFDQGLSGEGLLIWHIDDSIASGSSRLKNNNVNSGTPHLGVSLIPAGSFSVASSARDPWSKSNNTPRFASPRSIALNGKNSGVELDDISASGSPSISFTLRTLLNNPAFAANGTGNVVVAGGEGGLVNPDRGESAQIGIVPSKSSSIEVKIYNTGGELVAEKFTQGIANAQSFINWDGRDAEGRSVGSGIYFVKISGGGVDMVKKVAVIK